MDTCTYLGIYPNNIESASETLEAVCEAQGLDSDVIWSKIYRRFTNAYSSNFGNKVMTLMFECLQAELEKQGMEPDRIDWYVNGLDTDFYIDGETV